MMDVRQGIDTSILYQYWHRFACNTFMWEWRNTASYVNEAIYIWQNGISMFYMNALQRWLVTEIIIECSFACHYHYTDKKLPEA